MNKTYKYKWQILTQIWIGWLLHIIVLWGFGLYSLTKMHLHENYLYAGLMFIGFSMIGTLACIGLNSQRRPIKITDEGIAFTSLTGLRKHFLKWEEIVSIEQTHYVDALFSLNWNPFNRQWDVYRFINKNKTLNVDPGLNNLRGFLDDVNIYLHKYNIPVIYIDRMPAAAKTIRNSGYDLATQKKLRAEGLRHSLSEL